MVEWFACFRVFTIIIIKTIKVQSTAIQLQYFSYYKQGLCIKHIFNLKTKINSSTLLFFRNLYIKIILNKFKLETF